jgi:hypothetical protein
MQVSYFLGREVMVPAMAPKMSLWRRWLFLVMARNAVPATEFFRIPADRVVELGDLIAASRRVDHSADRWAADICVVPAVSAHGRTLPPWITLLGLDAPRRNILLRSQQHVSQSQLRSSNRNGDV